MMEPPPGPSFKPESRTTGAPTTAPPGAEAARRFPKPPALWRRIILLCIHPESWPMAARYPTRYTLLALGVAIVIAGIAAGIGDGTRLTESVQAFGKGYQKQQYPPLEISGDGVLTAKGEMNTPIDFSFPPYRVVVDPTNKTTPESLKMPGTLLITDRNYMACGPVLFGEIPMPLANLAMFGVSLPEPGKTTIITGKTIERNAPRLGIAYGIYLAFGLIFGNVFWAAMTMFLICPLIMVITSTGDGSLLLPKRAAYRMAAAFLVPLVLFGGFMHAAGYSIWYMLGGDTSMLFWFFAAAALAVWTGIMAKKMYGPPVRQRPSAER